MTEHALNPAFVRSVRSDGRVRRYRDGNGLYLLVRPASRSSGRLWVQRLTVHGRERELGLGSADTVTLREARRIALENRRIARSGGDPRRAGGSVPVFADAAESVIAVHQPTWKDGGERHAEDWRSTLGTYAHPRIGRMRVDEIAPRDVLAVLAPIWTAKPGAARKVRQRIGTVMKWAVAQGYRTDNPAGDAIAAALPRAPSITHMRAMPYAEVGAALALIRASTAAAGVSLAIELQAFCALRPAEARRARWDDIDLDAAVWTIPATGMKRKRAHRVPLSGRAVAVLREAGPRPVGWVFRSPATGAPFAESRAAVLFRKLGIEAVPHGFRSSFRDWAAENTDAPHAVMEAALAHVVRDPVERAYARSDLFARRRELMQQWADYIVATTPHAENAPCRS